MKITIIQCCDSVDSNDFLSILTEQGFYEADVLISKLNSIKPDKIFCSPFLRTLQTIYPYSIESGKYINIDYALLPIHKVDMNDKSTLFLNYNKNSYDFFEYITSIINDEYKSSIYSNNIKIKERKIDIKNRICTFLYDVCKSYENTKKNIALVVDVDIIPFITQYFNSLTRSTIEVIELK